MSFLLLVRTSTFHVFDTGSIPVIRDVAKGMKEDMPCLH